jgi:hypothetical protein
VEYSAHLASGKVYVGVAKDLALRLYGHAHRNSPRKLKRAILTHGVGAFLVQPIFVSFSYDRDFLLAAEEMLIAEWDAIRSGYNLVERDGRLGPSGPAFAAHQREVFAQPETKIRKSRAAQKLMDENPSLRAAFVAAGRTFWTSDEGRRKSSEARTARNKDPEMEAKRIAGFRAYFQRPDVIAQFEEKRRRSADARAKQKKLNRQIWLAQHKERLVSMNKDPAMRTKQTAGLRRFEGTPEGQENRKKLIAATCESRRDTFWITDESKCKAWPKNNPIPGGWRAGRPKRSRLVKPKPSEFLA